MDQRRRVIHGFAWITGDKRLCDYGPADAQHFAQTLRDLPVEFRWRTSAEGAMSRPLDEVLAEIEAMKVKTPRSDRTYNRDLTTMARFSRELAKTAWRPKFGKDLIVDFNAFTAASKENPGETDRMPWTEEQLVCAFSSPLYTGGGGCKRRLKADLAGKVWQDAAYWVPLLLAYTFMSREEACGLESVEIIFDVTTPFLLVKANMTKSKDDIQAAGLKRASRHRVIPLHPEILRLGFEDNVAAIEAEGHKMLFPELYRGDLAKRGGVRFYATCGRYLLDHVDGITPLLRTASGKRADLHSMRTSEGSALEDSRASKSMSTTSWAKPARARVRAITARLGSQKGSRDPGEAAHADVRSDAQRHGTSRARSARPSAAGGAFADRVVGGVCLPSEGVIAGSPAVGVRSEPVDAPAGQPVGGSPTSSDANAVLGTRYRTAGTGAANSGRARQPNRRARNQAGCSHSSVVCRPTSRNSQPLTRSSSNGSSVAW